MNLIRRRALVLSCLTAGWLGCATLRPGPPSVVIHVTSNVPDATVWIDDHLVAPVSDFGKQQKRLVVGFHRLEVRAPGYYSHFEELEAKPNTPLDLNAPLHPLLD